MQLCIILIVYYIIPYDYAFVCDMHNLLFLTYNQ